MKIAIVGTAPSSTHLAPYEDKSWKIWGIGVYAYTYKRVDKLFEIHDYLETDPTKTEQPVPEDYYENLIKIGVPIVVSDRCPFDPPLREEFPYEEARKLMQGEDMLTSTIAYMMAKAILEGATEISIYGCDMAIDNNEYFYQRPCMEQWIGLAKGRGIKVTIPKVSPLGRSPYIYGRNMAGRIDMGLFCEANLLDMAKQHRDRIEQIRVQRENLLMQMNAQNGAAESYERMAKTARALANGQDIKSLSHTAIIK